MQIQGGCHCGRIGYDAEINPKYVIICHCTDCQTNSGAPYRANVPVLPEKFHLRGEPSTYVKTGSSGAKTVLAFCGHCGSALYSHRQDDPPHLNLRLGAIKQRAELTPKAQYWCDSAMPWVMDISRIPRSPDQRPVAAEAP